MWLQSTEVTWELYLKIFVVVFKSVAKFQTKHQDLFEYFEDGSKSAGPHDSKVIYLLSNAQIKKKILERQTSCKTVFFLNTKITGSNKF